MTSSGPQPIISALLELQEQELSAKLSQARIRYAHGGDRGDAAEIAIREFLSQNLSNRFAVGEGEVIDSYGHRSKQCDVVIATDDHPFQSEAGPGLFLVEGVFAAGEVKAQLTTAELADVISKGQAIKALKRFNVGGAQVFASPSDHARWIAGPPPFFAFAFESSVATTTLLARLAEASTTTAVDALFVLGKGAAINFGDGAGTRRLRLSNGEDATGWVWVEGNPSLLEFLGWIHALPRLEHQGGMLIRYLAEAAAEGEGSMVVFPPHAPSPSAPNAD